MANDRFPLTLDSPQNPSSDTHRWATEAIDRFCSRFGEPHRWLAYHAALPLVLTPELLNYLRGYFLAGEVPWEAEVDLLLSELCQPAGRERYVMDTAVRTVLLQQMQADPRFGVARMRSVAELLLSYLRELHQTHPYLQQQELKTQEWAALVYFPEERDTVTQEITQAFEQALGRNTGRGGFSQPPESLVDPFELGRLAKLTQLFADQLGGNTIHRELLQYAQAVGQLLYGKGNAIVSEDLKRSYVVGSVELPSPESLISTKVEPENPIFPPLEPLEIVWGEWEPDEIEEPESIVLEPTQPQQTQQTVIDLPSELPTPQGWQNLQIVEFNFTVVTLKPNGTEQERYKRTARGFVETLEPPSLTKGRETEAPRWQRFLNQEVTLPRFLGGRSDSPPYLEMVEIPGGTFLMGAPETEKDSMDRERPQHSVTLPSFYLGRYPVTQAQWRVVAGWDKIDRVLKPDPSGFKGADRPVEQVSWEDAVEFCHRLKHRFGKDYCLPSEAQWEYACRAKTTTPFHFGETLNTDVANYDGNYTYGQGRKGIYRKETTPVTAFGVANPWGLVDVHGNVWEWCQDDWHENYNGAPEDGSAWLENISTTLKVRRGGSWIGNPRNCRSAFRIRYTHGYRDDAVGFRVCCLAPRGLP